MTESKNNKAEIKKIEFEEEIPQEPDIDYIECGTDLDDDLPEFPGKPEKIENN